MSNSYHQGIILDGGSLTADDVLFDDLGSQEDFGGAIYATDELCTHADASLCDGDIEGCSVVCPLHFGSFDIKTGQAQNPPACDDLKTYETKIEGDEIHIAV